MLATTRLQAGQVGPPQGAYSLPDNQPPTRLIEIPAPRGQGRTEGFGPSEVIGAANLREERERRLGLPAEAPALTSTFAASPLRRTAFARNGSEGWYRPCWLISGFR